MDLIDRQEAINALRAMQTYKLFAGDDMLLIDQAGAQTELMLLPPAQPEQLGTNLAEVGTDCISRQAAIDAINGLPKWIDTENGVCLDYADVIAVLSEHLPSAQPEIVRCKDCKYWIPYDWMFSEVWQSRNIADYPENEIGCTCCDMAMKANDFCSRAERRTDE